MRKAAQVECYSGTRYGERPLNFTVHDTSYVIKVVEKSWRTPSALHFLVRTEDDEMFELAYEEAADEWRVFSLPKSQEEHSDHRHPQRSEGQ